MKATEMRAKSADELKDMVMTLRQEQMTLRFQKSSQQLENTAKLRATRREIARAKTLIAESNKGTAAPKKAAAPKATPAAKAAKTNTATKAPAAKKAAKAKAE